MPHRTRGAFPVHLIRRLIGFQSILPRQPVMQPNGPNQIFAVSKERSRHEDVARNFQ